MKKLTHLVSLFFLLTAKTMYSQEYHKFRFGFGLGNTGPNTLIPLSILYLEPSLHVKHKLAIGWRVEFLDEKNIRRAQSFTMNAQYFLRSPVWAKKLRVFLGLGAGVFGARHDDPPTSLSTPQGSYIVSVEGDTFKSRAGFYPRIGFDYKHFSVTIDYNLIYRKYLSETYYNITTNQLLPQGHFYRSDNYPAFKLGYKLR